VQNLKGKTRFLGNLQFSIEILLEICSACRKIATFWPGYFSNPRHHCSQILPTSVCVCVCVLCLVVNISLRDSSILSSCEAEVQELMRQVDLMVDARKQEWTDERRSLLAKLDIREQEAVIQKATLSQRNSEVHVCSFFRVTEIILLLKMCSECS